jgi:NitT/TauT family transport system substrate-binding protein
MKKCLSVALVLLGGVGLAGVAPASPAAAETVKIAANIWVGYGPLWLARDLGLFKKHGVDVEIETVESVKDKYSGLVSNKYGVVAGSGGTSVIYMTKPHQFQYFVATDDSNGGDGVVSINEIASLSDLKGKTIALQQGSIAEFYLISLLKQAGLKESDVKLQDMNADDAGKAFLAKKVDAAVTWEPWLSKSKASDFGHLLIDSSATPGLLSDVLISTSDYAEKHPNELKAVVAGWNEAVAYLAEHQQEGIEIMAKAMGGWLKDTKVFAETLEGVKLYGAADNKTFFGTKAKPGPLLETVKEAVSTWSSLGKVQVKVAPEELMNYSFVNG